MSPRRLDFIDWMKCLGIFVIVYGHVGARTIDWFFSPIYPKQLGVALFVFVMGFSLAQERRPSGWVVYNRLFTVYVFGFVFALLMSGVTFLTRGTLALSNYEPFVLGVNVGLDYFPANPTTWYIGTYLHILVIWAVALRRLRVRAWMIAVWVICEIIIRMALMSKAGLYVAYMAAPNWGTVFLLGTLYGQKSAAEVRQAAIVAWLAIVALAALWYVMVPAPRELTFPFKRLAGDPMIDVVVTSAAVTTLYLAYTWLIFQATRRTVAPAFVHLVARNTIIVFIAHMPLHYGLQGMLYRQTPGVRLAIELLVCFVVLVLISEVVRRFLNLERLRQQVAERLGWSWHSGQVITEASPQTLHAARRTHNG